MASFIHAAQAVNSQNGKVKLVCQFKILFNM